MSCPPVCAKRGTTMRLGCGCYIIPKDVLDRFAQDASLPPKSQAAFKLTAELEPIWRTLRVALRKATQANLLVQPRLLLLAADPSITVYDCKNSTSIPGTPVSNPHGSTDATARRAYDTTKAVAEFFKQCFRRNSVDDAGMTLMSSVHYGDDYNNAFWDGAQMTYGDGDGQIFIDFTRSTDVIAHELTHGVTENTAGFVYTKTESGALNESVSDVFGSMFRQWQAKQAVDAADWLIGADIMGPAATAKGFTCLRDLSDPGGAHCLTPQPFHYSNYIADGDPHDNSGIPNHAFYNAAQALGGKSWDEAGKVWYAALTSKKAAKNSTFTAFAQLTRAAAKTLFPANPAVYAAIDSGWTAVGVP